MASGSQAMGMMHEVRARPGARVLTPRARAPHAHPPPRPLPLQHRTTAPAQNSLTSGPRFSPQGYFVGRKELVAWVQQYFQPNFSKVEDCASGVVYCQIVDNIYPGVVPMSKVKMSAKTEVEFIHNFKAR